MSITFQMEPRESYLYVACVGPFNLAEVQSMYRQALDACGQHGLSSLLLDARSLRGPITLGERYQWSVFVAEAHQAHVAAGHPPVRLAVLAGESLVDPRRFGEDVAQNRGADVRVTTDPAEAAAWLGIARETIV